MVSRNCDASIARYRRNISKAAIFVGFALRILFRAKTAFPFLRTNQSNSKQSLSPKRDCSPKMG